MREKKRKYSEFKIEVEFLNGDFEEIKFKDTNNQSYNEMMKAYKRVKEDYKETSCKIKFKGISDSGEIGCLFIKEIKTEDQKRKEEAEFIENTSVEELLNIAKESFEFLNRKKKILDDKQALYNKNIDTILHNLECDKYNTTEEKLRVVEEISSMRKARREVKNEYKAITYMHSQKLNDFIQMDKVDRALSWIKDSKIKNEVKQVENKIEYTHAPKTYKYKNDKERINLMSQLQKKYDKVIVDSSRMELVGYTKVYSK